MRDRIGGLRKRTLTVRLTVDQTGGDGGRSDLDRARMTVAANRLRLRVGKLASIESRVVGAGIADGCHPKSRSDQRRAAEVHAGLVADPPLAAPVPTEDREHPGLGACSTGWARAGRDPRGWPRRGDRPDAAEDTSRRGCGAPCAGRRPRPAAAPSTAESAAARRGAPGTAARPRNPRRGVTPAHVDDALVGLDIVGPVGDGGAQGHAGGGVDGVDIDSHSRPQ